MVILYLAMIDPQTPPTSQEIRVSFLEDHSKLARTYTMEVQDINGVLNAEFVQASTND